MYHGARLWQDKLYSSSYNVTLAVLIDGKTATGGWGSGGTTSRKHWVQQSFTKTVVADTVYIGGGKVPNWGTAQNYGPVELWAFNKDANAWKAIKTFPKLAGASIYKYSFPRQQSQYWRLYNVNGWGATTESRLEYSIKC